MEPRLATLAAAPGFLELIEQASRARSGQGLDSVGLSWFHREPHLQTLRAKLVSLRLHRIQPVSVQFPSVHIDAQAGQGFHALRVTDPEDNPEIR